MKLSVTFFLVSVPFALAVPAADALVADSAAIGGPFSERDLETRQTSCDVTSGSFKGAGFCAANTRSGCGSVSVSGYCPGGSSNQCCRPTRCSGKYSAYFCRNTYKGCDNSNYSFKSGYCPGGSDVKCCAPP